MHVSPIGCGTIELVDQLNQLRRRVPRSGGVIACATATHDEQTVRAWDERKTPPTGVHADGLSEPIGVRRWR
jgi:hypothetical protein